MTADAPLPKQDNIARRDERKETNWIAKIKLPDGLEIPCNVKDVSASGAKIGIPAGISLPETFMLKVIGKDFVCLVRMAWRRGDYVGVHIERIAKLALPAAAEASQPTQHEPADTIRARRSRFSSY